LTIHMPGVSHAGSQSQVSALLIPCGPSRAALMNVERFAAPWSGEGFEDATEVDGGRKRFRSFAPGAAST